MIWSSAVQRIRLSIIFVSVLIAMPPPGRAQQSGPSLQTETAVPQVLSPLDGARLPRQGEDPSCPEQGPCTKFQVEGRVTPGSSPFLAVAPVLAAPRIWIQPPITTVNRNGTFNGMVYLGTDKLGAGEKYRLLIFACQNKQRFREGEVLTDTPNDCVVSDAVTVLRMK